ncbi:MAG: hypothetical protein JNM99_10120 [Verrucomicrobiaceae bacterium]|nr:hypothetical protein [Verrucomicrobiaceae bacterium]
MTNPFQLTRAADLDDDQINQLWVDPGNKLSEMLRPSSPLPMIILGGRGSGKTHLVRYHSYALQRRVHGKEHLLARVRDCKYLGIVFRCTGLHASRFSKKRVPEAQWHDLFGLHLELTLGQLLLNTAIDFIDDVGARATFSEEILVESLRGLFDKPLGPEVRDLNGFRAFIQTQQRNLDHQIGMASFRRSIEPPVTVRHGQLIFGIPQKLCEHVPCLKGIMFTLFIDEYEHFFADLQKHVNTLIRERENPVTFKIGARPHGMHTYQTWGGNEELKQGSDYELMNLDALLREAKTEYKVFALELCLKRIRFSANGWPAGWNEVNAEERLRQSFEPSKTPEELVAEKLKQRGGGTAPWLEKLEDYLIKDLGNLVKLGIKSKDDVTTIINHLRCNDPLIEKTSSFIFYHAWRDRKKNLLEAAIEIANSAIEYAASKDPNTDHAKKLGHFRDDMRDQMLLDLNLDRQAGANGILSRYVGIDAWITMSDGIIRNLISTLKGVYGWALFNGEDIYAANGISLAAQIRGVEEASVWFVKDASVLESDRGKVDAGMRRVAELLRQVRFSRKPTECSLCRFSVDLNTLEPATKKIIQAAEMWSLLIRDQDRRSRNGGKDVALFRVNPLVSPSFYLPVSARGNIDLSAEECTAIFDTVEEGKFKQIERDWVNRYNPPFSRVTGKRIGRKKATGDTTKEDDELLLF